MKIRLLTLNDTDSIWSLVDQNRAYLKQWLPWLDYNTSIKDTEKFISDCITQFQEKKSYVNVIENGNICGICGFNSFNWSIKAGYIGYWVAEQFRGQGLATEACKQLELIGFNELGLNKIEIHAASKNQASRNVAIKLGYKHTGTLLDAENLYGNYVDHEIYVKRRS